MPESDSVVAAKPSTEGPATPDVLLAIATRDAGTGIAATVQAAHSAAQRLNASVALFLADFASRDDTPALMRQAVGDTMPLRQAAFPADGGAGAGAVPTTIASRPEALRAALDAARHMNVRALVVIDPARASGSDSWSVPLTEPVLAGRADLVVPLYARQRFAGGLNSGVAYPLTRALYGKQVRQSLVQEFACSAATVNLLLASAWPPELARFGAESWLLASVLCSPMRVAQAHVAGALAPVGSASEPLSQVVARVVGAMFTESGRQAAVWQRVRGSKPVETSGVPASPEAESGTLAADAAAALDAFRLAQRNLAEVWGLIMPPQTLLELRRLTLRPADDLRFPDLLWARVVYDFMLAHRTRVMNRDHLAAAFTPLYLGWFGSLVGEVAQATPDVVDERIEKLCLRFEEQKPYVIGRWRSPDRFNP